MDYTDNRLRVRVREPRRSSISRPTAGAALWQSTSWMPGRDVLIVYDDLSKHAVAYRALSLLLHKASAGP